MLMLEGLYRRSCQPVVHMYPRERSGTVPSPFVFCTPEEMLDGREVWVVFIWRSLYGEEEEGEGAVL